MATTTKGFPYPEGPDPVDAAGDIQALAEAVDDAPGIEQLTAAEIAALTVDQKWAGRVVWNSTTSKLQVSDGATFSDVGNADAILATLLDAKGDLIVGTAADTAARLAVGSNGTRLQADSGESSGVKWAADPVVLAIAVSDETTALTTGTAKVTFRMPFAMTLTAVRASVTTAPTGSTLVVDINEGGASVLGTKLSIDASEKTSTTAASAATITDTALADDAEITIDIDQVGSTVAGAGLKVYLIGTRA